MRIVLAAACVLALAGCHSTIQLNAARGLPQAGTSSTGGSLDARTSSASFAAVLIGLGLVSATVHGGAPESPAAAPELDPRRTVSEQDCTRPLDLSGGNLRCK